MTPERAARELERYTCILWKGETVFRSTQRGVAPLMALVNGDLRGFHAADRVVGRASALLYCLLGIRTLYTPVISRPALALLREHQVSVSADTVTESIRNRKGDGPCPMELATREITDPAQAPEVIRKAALDIRNP